jgi:hypothetical protein
MSDRYAKLDEALFRHVEEVGKSVVALDPQEALILQQRGRHVAVTKNNLIVQENELQLAVFIYLADSIADALQMQRELKQQLSDHAIISRVLFKLLTVSDWIRHESFGLAAQPQLARTSGFLCLVFAFAYTVNHSFYTPF